ncbi:MAG: hypothetical protein MJ209_00885 [archaeon]|nr:hypothetical protein [archaeon]
MLNEEFPEMDMDNVIAIPVDVNSLMAAYQLGYLTALDEIDSDYEDKPNPDSYRLICESMAVSPADTIGNLINEIVSRKVDELIKEKQERDSLKEL